MQRVLFAASEAAPLVKTGGLGDVCGSLPKALARLRQDVWLVLPGYSVVKEQMGNLSRVADISIQRVEGPVGLLRGDFPGSSLPCLLVDIPAHFERSGHPYVGPDGADWPDNAQRFAAFARAVVALALDRAGLAWRPDVLHCHDWQTGLVPALLAHEEKRPATVFTLHNLAYQGRFPRDAFERLALPSRLWSPQGLEFYDELSFIKGGLVFADLLSTVSPTYAREILTPDLGYGLEGLLRHRSAQLSGILNGIDANVWNPATDPWLAATYDERRLAGKSLDKQALQTEMGLPPGPDVPLLGMIGRLVEQKGFDILISTLGDLMHEDLQCVILGSGEPRHEEALREAAHAYPDRVAARIGFDEGLAHRIEAGADLFLMPSRFEPCGLNQMYSLRYGTVPVVRRTGGLNDTVVDATPDSLADGTATGFVFQEPDPRSLLSAVQRAIELYRQPPLWHQLMLTGMGLDFSWETSAWHYLLLYRRAQQALRADGRGADA
jgi:starch synthase